MRELINIKEENGRNVVSARELHEFLEVVTPFRKWVDRMLEYGFEENTDFSRADIFIRGNEAKDYALTIDCAKEISMLQRTDKGKEARQYFIEAEKQNRRRQVGKPVDLLRFAADEIEKRDKQIAQLKPKAEFVERVFDCEDKIDVGQAAKVLGLPYGRNTLFSELRERGVFFKNRNEPKQSYVDRGYFEMKELFITRHNHPPLVKLKTFVTQKGLAYLSTVFETSNKRINQASLV